MLDLEAKLKELKLRAPSPVLDERVFGQSRRRRTEHAFTKRRAPIGLVVAIAVSMWVVGFCVGIAWHGEHGEISIETIPDVQVYVIYDSIYSCNPFDFTRPANDVSFENFEVKDYTPKGV